MRVITGSGVDQSYQMRWQRHLASGRNITSQAPQLPLYSPCRLLYSRLQCVTVTTTANNSGLNNLRVRTVSANYRFK